MKKHYILGFLLLLTSTIGIMSSSVYANEPIDSDGDLLTKVFQPAVKGVYEGVVCHYHLTRKKIDTAGLELDKIIHEINENPNE